MADQDDINIQTLISDRAGGFVVQVELGAGHVRTFGGFGSEEEARACLERRLTDGGASPQTD